MNEVLNLSVTRTYLGNLLGQFKLNSARLPHTTSYCIYRARAPGKCLVILTSDPLNAVISMLASQVFPTWLEGGGELVPHNDLNPHYFLTLQVGTYLSFHSVFMLSSLSDMSGPCPVHTTFSCRNVPPPLPLSSSLPPSHTLAFILKHFPYPAPPRRCGEYLFLEVLCFVYPISFFFFFSTRVHHALRSTYLHTARTSLSVSPSHRLTCRLLQLTFFSNPSSKSREGPVIYNQG